MTSPVELRVENARQKRVIDAMRAQMSQEDSDSWSQELWMVWRLKAAQLEVELDRQGTRLALCERALRQTLDKQDARDAVRAWLDAVKEDAA